MLQQNFKSIMMKHWQVIFSILGLYMCIKSVLSSPGDRSVYYVSCRRDCTTNNCTGAAIYEFYINRPLYKQLLHWDCKDECRYMCMWKTVDLCKKHLNGYVPQFYGKWPFFRVFGLQEPASAVFSVTNAISHQLMILRFRQAVPADAPMYWDTHFYYLVCLNAWFWSAVFHARDVPLTEKLDYFCALSLVAYPVFHLARRCLIHKPRHVIITLGYMLLTTFVTHISYLAFIEMDYGWNMKVNISFAAANVLGWCTWSVYHMVRYKRHYCWSVLAMWVLLPVVFALEQLDFPPLWWMVDAHALWHAATTPLPILWYRFVTDDCLWLHEEQKKREGDSLPYHSHKVD